MKKTAAIFDIDETILNGTTEAYLTGYLFRIGMINPFKLFVIIIWFIFYKLGFNVDTLFIRRYTAKLLKNWDVVKTDKIVEKYFNEVLVKKIYPEAVSLIKKHTEEGLLIILTTAAFSNVAKYYKRYLEADYMICTKLEEKEGKFTGKIEGLINYGENKLKNIQRFKDEIDFKNSFAYMDHFSDLSILENVGHPVAVNPDKRLRKIAEKKKWRMIDLK